MIGARKARRDKTRFYHSDSRAYGRGGSARSFANTPAFNAAAMRAATSAASRPVKI